MTLQHVVKRFICSSADPTVCSLGQFYLLVRKKESFCTFSDSSGGYRSHSPLLSGPLRQPVTGSYTSSLRAANGGGRVWGGGSPRQNSHSVEILPQPGPSWRPPSRGLLRSNTRLPKLHTYCTLPQRGFGCFYALCLIAQAL